MRRMFPKSEILSEQVPLVPGSSSTLVPDLCKSCPSRHLLITSVILVIIAISRIRHFLPPTSSHFDYIGQNLSFLDRCGNKMIGRAIGMEQFLANLHTATSS